MFTVARATRADVRANQGPVQDRIAVALLGLGHVGSAVARIVLDEAVSIPRPLHIMGALVRDLSRPRLTGDRVSLTGAGDSLLDGAPDVVVEVLGGLEPARTLVLRALERGIPVVTANKSLLAVHGDEIFAAAAVTATPLRYEAAVLAGVPFLDTFARRPFAAALSSLCGVVNGTTNFILTAMAGGRAYPDALAEAQRQGFAEPDPSNDVCGIDAAQKLTVLLRHFARCSVQPGQIETVGLDGLTADDLTLAARLGGAIKPIVAARWDAAALSAFAGPAFVPAAHPLARIDGVQNAIVLGGAPGRDLVFAGPGAGPAATAATILDDVIQVVEERSGVEVRSARHARAHLPRTTPAAPATGWFVRMTGGLLPGTTDIANRLGAHGVRLRRVSDDGDHGTGVTRWLIVEPCGRDVIEPALAALRAGAGCETFCIRAVEAPA